MSSSSSVLQTLVHCGSELAKLLREATCREGFIRRTIASRNKAEIAFRESFHEKVKALINKLLNDLKGAQGYIAQDSGANVMGMIEGLLQKLTEMDKVNAKTYEELAEHVKNFKSDPRQTSVAVSSSSGDSSCQYDYQEETCVDFDDVEFDNRYKNLTYDEKRCLFYFSLFPDGSQVKKRELIYWWLGMMSLEWHSEGGEAEGQKVLAKLVAEGFIVRLIRDNKLSNTYKMRSSSVRSKVMEKAEEAFSMRYAETTQMGVFALHYVGDKTDQPVYKPERIEALINTGTHTICGNNRVRAWLSSMKNALVVQLGSWRGHHDDHQDSADYIVVEDVDSLGVALQKLKQVRFLSLRGISGLVQLPSHVCTLKNVVVLDLRACNNLESLPREIGSLSQLICLDLSECYLLAEIPAGITLLTKLRVLKGFIINPDEKIGAQGQGQKYVSESCEFRDLIKLKLLKKLSVRTRRLNFPTQEDGDVLHQMKQLNTLRIAWVGQFSDPQSINDNNNNHSYKLRSIVRGMTFEGDLRQLPEKLHKLELQGVPENIASQFLGLISEQKEKSTLEKLYFRGAHGKLNLVEYCFPHVKQVRLRYLPQLDMDWDQFMHSFPSLTRLHVFECPNLISFQCQNNGVWERNVG